MDIIRSPSFPIFLNIKLVVQKFYVDVISVINKEYNINAHFVNYHLRTVQVETLPTGSYRFFLVMWSWDV